MPIGLTEYLRVYVFGSAVLSPDKARDLDLLVVYDRTIVAPDQVYRVITETVSSFRSAIRMPIHLAAFTKEEAAAENIIEEFGCVPFEVWVAAQSMRILSRFASARTTRTWPTGDLEGMPST